MRALSPPEAANDARSQNAASEILIPPALAGAHVPERRLRLSGRTSSPARFDGGVLASLILHGATFAFAAWLIAAAPPAFDAGGEEAIPVEVIIAGSVESAATQAGAKGDTTVEVPLPPDVKPAEIAQVDVQSPELPDAPVDVTLPSVDVPTPPEATVAITLPQVEVAPLPQTVVDIRLPTVDTPLPPQAVVEIKLPPVEVQPPPLADVIVNLPAVEVPAPPDVPAVEIAREQPPNPTEPQVAVAKPEAVASPKPVPPAPQAKPVPPKPKPPVQAKPRVEPPKPVEPRRVAARPPVDQPTPRRVERTEQTKPQTAARGQGAQGVGDSDRTRDASTRGASGGAGRGAGAAATASYRSQVMAHLARFKVYPEQARERGLTGRAMVSFTLTRAGQVTSVSLAGSSGAPMLDSATLAMVRRAAPFPAAPEGAPTSFNAAINYNLR